MIVRPGLSEDTSWGSFMVPLTACLAATSGPVLEVGIGEWSTPFLTRYCLAAGRKLLSVDEDPEWIELFKSYAVGSHVVERVRYDVFLPEAAKQDWSVVFLDQSPGGKCRADAAMMFRNTAEYIVSHDFAGDQIAPIEAVMENWTYCAVAYFSPRSLVLSNKQIPWFDKKVDVLNARPLYPTS